VIAVVVVAVVVDKVNIMSNINEPFVNDGGRFEVVFASLASARYQLRLSILGRSTVAKMYFVTLSIQRCNCLNTLGAFIQSSDCLRVL